MLKFLARFVLPLCCLGPVTVTAQTVQWDFPNVTRIIAVGDVHGAHAELVELLKGIGLIDAEENWRGGQTHLVSLGDLLDRGPDSRQVMDLLMKLQPQALAAGGRVHVVLGNHELMNLTGDFRDVSEAEQAAFGGAQGHAAAFKPGAKYGDWLSRLPAMLRINDTLFVHGGLPPDLPEPDELNGQVHRLVETLRAYPVPNDLSEQPVVSPPSEPGDTQAEMLNASLAAASHPLLNDRGPLWYRGTSRCHAALEAGRLAVALQRFGAARVVVGHTPTPTREIAARLQDRVWVIDTGMLQVVYRGNARALLLEGDTLTALSAQGPAPVYRAGAFHDRVLPWLQNGRLYTDSAGVYHAELDGETVEVEVQFMSRKKLRKAQAAFVLDRFLELYLVAPSAIRQVDGRSALILPRRTLVPETERNFSVPNYCASGSVFDLVAVYDALIGKTDRSGANLMYRKPTNALELIDHADAFPGGARLPVYASQPELPAGLVQALSGLSEQALQARFGDLLKASEIRAILKRRDKILTWPVVP